MSNPIPYRYSLRERAAINGKPEWAIHFMVVAQGPNAPGPIIRAGYEWPSDAQRKYLARLISAGENAILTFARLDMAIDFFKLMASMKTETAVPAPGK